MARGFHFSGGGAEALEQRNFGKVALFEKSKKDRARTEITFLGGLSVELEGTLQERCEPRCPLGAFGHSRRRLVLGAWSLYGGRGPVQHGNRHGRPRASRRCAASSPWSPVISTLYVMSSAVPRIESAIRDHLAPVLRADGFMGSGRIFRRTIDGWIHVVGVQGSRSGGEFAVNLALQPTSIPDVRGNTPDPKKITEELCEFRRRMSESEASQDMWWKHKSTPESMAAAVREATRTYEMRGRTLLNEATSASSDLNAISSSAFTAGTFNFQGFGSTMCRMAFSLARLRMVQGLKSEARAFAVHALNNVGGASILKAEIQAFLEAA